jgi:hypothetical protein
MFIAKWAVENETGGAEYPSQPIGRLHSSSNFLPTDSIHSCGELRRTNAENAGWLMTFWLLFLLKDQTIPLEAEVVPII